VVQVWTFTVLNFLTVEVACRSSGGWHFTVNSGINHTVQGMGFHSIGVHDVG
jgi:hypothetical protein